MPASPNTFPWRPFKEVLGSEYERIVTWFDLRDPVVAETLRSVAYQLDTVEVQRERGRWRFRTEPDCCFECRLSDTEVLDGFRAGLRTTLQKSPLLVLVYGVESTDEIDVVLDAAVASPDTTFLFLDPNPVRLSIRLSFLARTERLENGGAIWAVGEPLDSVLAGSVHRHALYSIGDDCIRVVFGCGEAGDSGRSSLVPIIEALVEHMTPWRTTLHQSVVRFRESIQRRSDRPRRIWSSGAASHYTSTPILHALHRGLRMAGIECVLTETLGNRSDRCIENAGLVHAAPDTLLFLNGPTRLHVPEGEFHRMVWITDDPALRHHREHAPRFDPEEYVFYADRTFEPELIRQGARRPMLLPAFAVVEHQGTYRPDWAFPMVYVGMIHHLDPLLAEVSLSVRDMFEEAVHCVSKQGMSAIADDLPGNERISEPEVMQLAERICAKCSRTFSDELLQFRFAVYTLAVSRRRWDVVRALLPLGLHVFGGKDWLPLLGDAFAARYHGYISYELLTDLYRSAALTLNVHSIQCPTCLNVRDFDVLCAGGCLLTDPVATMGTDSLMPGRDCAVAFEPEALAAMAAELLVAPLRRETLSQWGHATVMTKHLPHHRAGTMIQAMTAL